MLNYYKFIGVLSLGLTLNVFSQKNEIYDHRELRKGQLGVGYTVFSSDTGLEKFDVKILGVMKNKWGPGKDLIIANLEHPRLEANGQVVAGMSGSPVYIDGKLLGAVGYGLGQFTDKPFAGITPAKDMLAILEAPSGLEARASYELDDLLKPIALPLAISGLGLSQSAKEFFGPEFRKRGFEMISGGFSAGNLGKTKNNNKLYPGGPVAVSFVTGAQNISGIGTVTWIGNKNGEPQWLAFGHPFNSEGATDLPVSSAEIITTVFSQSYSYKLGQALAPIGTMTRDNLPAIGGVIGQLPVMTDLSIEFENKNKMKKYNYQVTPKPDDSPLFIAAALAGVLNADVHKNAGGTYEFDIELIVDEEIGEQKIKFSRTVASDSKPLEPRVAKMIVADLSELLNQKFKKVFIKNIKIKIKKSDEIKWAKLKQVNFGFRNKVLDLLISYEPWQKELKKFKINFDLDKLRRFKKSRFDYCRLFKIWKFGKRIQLG